MRNWKEYNENLVNRGNISIWFSEDLLEDWKKQGSMGRPSYSNRVIELAWVLRELFSKTFRATEGFLCSILKFMGLGHLQAPDYTTISRRGRSLQKTLKLSRRRPSHILIDSSGLKILGQGEWKAKKFPGSSRRKWRKLHVSVDLDSGEVQTLHLGDNSEHDSIPLPKLVQGSGRRVKKVYADGAYDGSPTREWLHERGIEDCIPPRKDAVLKGLPHHQNRNKAIILTRLFGGDLDARRAWARLSGYNWRTLVESWFSRFKRVFGGRLKCRNPETQATEVTIRTLILNKFIYKK